MSLSALAAPVTFSGAVATADQNFMGGVAATIDGDVNSQGWALFDGAGAEQAAQSVIYTADSALTASDLHIALYHTAPDLGHSINEFRISVTSDVSPSSGSSWTALSPSFLGSSSPVVSFLDVGDNRTRALGNTAGNLVYGVSAAAPFGNITGYQLEVFPFDFDQNDLLPATVGRGVNGNIVLSEFTVDDAALPLIEGNVALNKPSTGSVAFGFPTSGANDGNTATFNHADTIAIDPNPFWEVDLQGSFEIDRIEIVDRIGCCSPNRFNGASISVLDAGMTEIANSGPVGTFPDNNPSTAPLVYDNGGSGFSGVGHIRVDGDGVDNYFQFSELRAIISQPLLPSAERNLALGALVSASGNTWSAALPASLLTNGDRTGAATHPFGPGGNPNEPTPVGFYFEIDLAIETILDRIDLFGRADGCCPERLTNYRVEVLDDDMSVVWTADLRTDGSNPGNAGVDSITGDLGTGTFAGRFVRISNNGGGNYSPQMAEVEVYGTPIPEPSSAVLVAVGLVCLAGGRRSRSARLHARQQLGS